MAPRTERRDRWVQVLGSLAVLGLCAALIFVIPTLVGVSWGEIGANLVRVPLLGLVGLTALWLAGMFAHVPALRAAMPGLTAGQALTLNTSGSAVSNVLPLGGPAAMGLGYAMAKSWKFRPESYASYLVTTNLWSMAGRFVAGTSILAVAALCGTTLPAGIGTTLLAASGFVLAGFGATIAALRTPAAATALGARLDRIAQRLRPGRSATACSTWLLASRVEMITALQVGWKRMSAGVLVYLGLQATLLWACLYASGTAAPVGIVAVAFAVERLISLAPITPGAAGFAEVGTIAALHAFGIDPVNAAAGVLLYRVYMFALDIPLGGVLALRWLRTQRRTATRPEAVPVADEVLAVA